MFKKLIFIVLIFSLILPVFLLAGQAMAVDNSQVCGLDGNNYDTADAAEAAGVDVAYELACVNPASEDDLYEASSGINFAGMLVEIGSTDIPTTIIVRPNAGGADYTVNVSADTVLGQRWDQITNLSDWIPGDQIRVIGEKNENTETVDASILVNLSIVIKTNSGANGWITKIDKDQKIITYQWMNREHDFAYDDDTRFVAAGKNPASLDDLEINDRIRARLLKRDGQAPLAKIVVVLRRGENLFMKIRTFRPNATLVSLNSTVVPTTIQVKIENTPGLKANDVNNLIGSEGTLVTVNISEDTKLVRKYFGRTTLEEFAVGDSLHIVGRVNDDGTVDAKLLKNNSIWRTSTRGHAGLVTEVNSGENYLMINWTPIKYLTRQRLKERLDASDNTVTVQSVNQTSLSQNLRQRVKQVATSQVGRFTRQVRFKKVVINRISHNQVSLDDLIDRLPVRSIKVEVTDATKIVVGINTSAGLSDIQVGDRVRVRGVRQANEAIVIAETIVVVNSLPEIDDSLDSSLDDVNSIVSEISTDDSANAIVEDTVSATEEEIELESETETEIDSSS